jgi:signal transduction protein with GAF and PtsI domain
MHMPTTAYSFDSAITLLRNTKSNGGSAENPEITLLNRAASRLFAGTAIDEALNEIAELVMISTHCDSCTVYVLNGENLVLRAAKNPAPGVSSHVKWNKGQATGASTEIDAEPLMVGRCAYLDRRFKLFNEPTERYTEAFVSIPLMGGGHLVGVLNAQSRNPREFTKREAEFLMVLGFLIGAELERGRLENQNSQLCEQMEARKIIERAKGILQNDLGLSEEEAYLTLQRESRQRRKLMKEVASAIVLSEELRRAR